MFCNESVFLLIISYIIFDIRSVSTRMHFLMCWFPVRSRLCFLLMSALVQPLPEQIVIADSFVLKVVKYQY